MDADRNVARHLRAASKAEQGREPIGASTSAFGRGMARLREPCDGRSLVVLQRGLGVILFVAIARYFWNGWIDAQFVAPAFHFTYAPFAWVRPLPGPGMPLLFAALLLFAGMLALGRRPRLSAGAFCLGFTYVQLCDKAYYLNHYYLVSLLTLWFALMPRPRDGLLPRGWLVALRLQVALVYLHAGLAKLGSDWLLRGEPLGQWLTDLRFDGSLGALFALKGTAIVCAWAGMLFDLSIPALLLFPRTRRLAFAVVVVFHGATALLFPIGIFPWVMTLAATVLLAPDWPKRFGWQVGRTQASIRCRPWHALLRTGITHALLPGLLLLQALLPLRAHRALGSAHWSEEGFRFAWKVMLIEKQAAVDFEVVRAGADGVQREEIELQQHLTPFQIEMMAGQPDMILEFAHHLGAARDIDSATRGPVVAVHARSLASLNGRAPGPLVARSTNLLSVARTVPASEWVVPLETRGSGTP